MKRPSRQAAPKIGFLARSGLTALPRIFGEEPHKARKPYVAVVVDEHVLRLNVFVDQTALVGMAERRCQVDGTAKEASQIERLLLVPLPKSVESPTARIGENEDYASFVTRERQRLGRPRRQKFGRERVLSCSSRRRRWGVGCLAERATTRTGDGYCLPR
jgi:hypothetical protein